MPVFYLNKNKDFSKYIPLSALENHKANLAFNTHKWDYINTDTDTDTDTDTNVRAPTIIKCKICNLLGIKNMNYNILIINEEVCYDTCDEIIIREIIK